MKSNETKLNIYAEIRWRSAAQLDRCLLTNDFAVVDVLYVECRRDDQKRRGRVTKVAQAARGSRNGEKRKGDYLAIAAISVKVLCR